VTVTTLPRRLRLRVLLPVLVISVLTASAVSADPNATEQASTLRKLTASAPAETTFDEHDAESRFYADKHGVTAERAAEYANWQEAAQGWLTELPELTDIYADGRLLHGGSDAAPDLPVGEVVVQILVTDPNDPRLLEIVRALEGIRSGSFAADVNVAQVPLTLAELDQLVVEAAETWDGGDYDVVYDFHAGTVELVPFEGDVVATWLYPAARGLTEAEAVAIANEIAPETAEREVHVAQLATLAEVFADGIPPDLRDRIGPDQQVWYLYFVDTEAAESTSVLLDYVDGTVYELRRGRILSVRP
jgi:hypothetical protein